MTDALMLQPSGSLWGTILKAENFETVCAKKKITTLRKLEV